MHTQPTLQKRIIANNLIKALDVRLIDETGKQLGVVSFSDAMHLARERNLDLIQVTEKVDPPVCKLGEYGKYLYHLQKKERGSAGKESELKEIRLTFSISPHDMETRAKQAKKFLLRGDRIKIVVRLRGRQKSLEKVAQDKIKQFLECVRADVAIKLEREVKMEPRGLTAIATKA